jgi:AraC-like DNA-binding protein
MYNQLREDTLYIMLYAAVTALAILACCYLLFRQGNAFAKDVTPPARLRRWTAAFFAVFVVNHVWYMGPSFFLTSSDDIKMANLVGGLLDCMTFFPLAIVVLLCLLQDRRRPLWSVVVMVAPLIVGMAWCVVTRSDTLFPMLIGYILLMSIGLIIYMVHALKQYGRWLRDNYADLEHKEIWQSFVVLAIILLVFCIYVSSGEGPSYEYLLQLIVVVLIGYLLWRVETLSDLSIPVNDAEDLNVPDNRGHGISPGESFHIRNNIGSLLQQHCIDKQLYLQHDLTILQLAKTIGTNRYYLSQYFSNQSTTYNAYINDLRINHFVSLYHEAVDSKRSITAQQLALESGYRSYNTFRDAFKRKTGQSVTAWIRALHEGIGEP